MKVTDAFLGEHAVFYAQFDAVEGRLAELELRELQSMMATIAAALASHAQLEDELLFARLEPFFGAGMGPVAVMRMEHEVIEGGLERLPTLTSADEARQVTTEVIRTARDHFMKEEQVLYPMAHQALGEEALEGLGEVWAERRSVVVKAAGMSCH